MARTSMVTDVVLAGDFMLETVAGHVETDELLAAARANCVEQSVFKEAMRMLASGVVLVTTRVDGRPWGLTISSCCSLSVDPPQLLVSLGRTTMSCKQILRTRRFGVSILGTSHRLLAERGAAVGAAKFVDEFCEPDDDADRTDPPIIVDALFHLQCSVRDVFAVSDHELVVGLVERAVTPRASAGGPLLFWDRRFWDLGAEVSASPAP